MDLKHEASSDTPALLPRSTFNEIAALYDQMRPSYPEQTFDDIVSVSRVGADSSLLEIGCGTGKATAHFSRRGLQIHCVELGSNMAAIARQILTDYPRVTIEVADFDLWTTAARYDLVYIATAYHWLNPETREQRIASLLKPQGWLVLFRNCHVRNGSSDDFVDAAREVYLREAPSLVKVLRGVPHPSKVAETGRVPLTSGFFEELPPHVYLWQQAYTATEYVQMLDTHSENRLLADDERRRLFDGLISLIDMQFGGSIVKDYATILQMARKVGSAA